MTRQRITKRTVDALEPNGSEFTLWDSVVSRFWCASSTKGLHVLCGCLQGGLRTRRARPALHDRGGGKITPERARARAKVILGAVAHGHDPAAQKATERGVPTIAELADRFMIQHVTPKRKAQTAEYYRYILSRIVGPAVGTVKADKLSRSQVGKDPFVVGRDAFSSQSHGGSGRQHVRLCGPRGHRARRHQSSARHRQVQGRAAASGS